MNIRPSANKELGQHYLNDKNVITKICSDFAHLAQNIIEIGPGPGILTEQLSKLQKPFKVIEKDLRFKENLEQFLSPERIQFQDALAFNENILPNTWLVSNLPYNASVPLFLKFLKIPEVKYMTLMFQKEVGEKIIPLSHIKNPMNSLLGLAENYCEGKLLLKVAPGAFTPPPQVNSIVISLKRRENPVIPLSDFESYERYLRLLFSMKRKQVFNVLRTSYEENKIAKALAGASLEKTARAESFNLKEIQLLYQKLVWE